MNSDVMIWGDRLLKLKAVLSLIPVSRSSWYQGIKTGRYPAPVKLGPRAAAWRASEINLLIENGVVEAGQA